MTKKFQKQLKKRLITAVVGLASVTTLGLSLMTNADFFVVPAEIGNIEPSAGLSIESSKTVQGKPTNVEVQSGNVVVCESLVQGIRDCNLPDGTYTFKVVRKHKWSITGNKNIPS